MGGEYLQVHVWVSVCIYGGYIYMLKDWSAHACSEALNTTSVLMESVCKRLVEPTTSNTV